MVIILGVVACLAVVGTVVGIQYSNYKKSNQDKWH